MLRINEIHKSYDKKVVLDGISFSIEKGKITSLIGRNGSGKTTTLEIISRILTADSGNISIDEKIVDENISLQENIAYLPDRFDLFKYSTPKRIIEYYEIIYPKFDRGFATVELEKMKIGLNKNVKNLSKGMTAILGLIIILATNADYIIMDEILDGIDVLNKRKIIEYILDAAANEKGILISSHSLGELQSISDNAVYLSLDGKISEVKDDGNINKVQIVFDTEIEDEDRNKLLITSEIGRVVTVLLEEDVKNTLSNLKTKVVQYDILPTKYEDIFILESAKEERNARTK